MAAPQIIAVASTKGGVGKTTVALQLAIARAKQGREVWVVDGDRQKTAMMALSLRNAQEIEPGIPCASYPEGKLLRSQIKLQRDKWETIVIDVGGFDSTTLRAALSICDVLIVPFQPRSFDIWGLSQMSDLLDEVNQIREPFPVYAILNSADTVATPDNQDAIESVADFPALTFLDTPLCRRKAFSNASGFGLGVSEVKVKDKKAIAEVDALVKAIFKDE